MPDTFVESEMRQVADVMKLFTDRLGETTIPAGTIKHVYSPKRKGQGRAGIARPGMIVTSEGLTLKELANDPENPYRTMHEWSVRFLCAPCAQAPGSPAKD
jgi:hypothetical protein